MITEYRALRASVLRMWAATRNGDTLSDEMRQLTRFNEAIDQALTESVARYTEQVHEYTNLFMGMLGHDIRNPLGTIHLSAQLLVMKGQLTKEAAAPIVHAARRIQEIVEMIVDFSRAQARGAMPVHPTPGQLEAVAQSVAGETRVRHPDAILTVKVDGDTHGEWDQGRVGQLLSNLLQNAVLYGTRDQPITLTLQGEPNHVSLSVHNHGRVIPTEARDRIFLPRSRGDGGEGGDAQRAPNGLGLGLYICREIVKAHGGKLTLRSEAREGTTFRVVLPRHPDGATP
jgi:signal transduction histidine kinase